MKSSRIQKHSTSPLTLPKQMCQHTPVTRSISEHTVATPLKHSIPQEVTLPSSPLHNSTGARGLTQQKGVIAPLAKESWYTHLLPEQRLTTLTAKTVPLFLGTLQIYWFGQKWEPEKHIYIHTYMQRRHVSKLLINSHVRGEISGPAPMTAYVWIFQVIRKKKIPKQLLEQPLHWNWDLCVISVSVHPLSIQFCFSGMYVDKTVIIKSLQMHLHFCIGVVQYPPQQSLIELPTAMLQEGRKEITATATNSRYLG